ncbi:beta-propeller fold lactonase family protein [Actinoplanes bogorensis]|uniref:Beta-propeller fold lactonase family protein n=1 Tax=Paractinoplanes bogorensis TaxID=1610840 RepID=A0ABS5YPJ3_9ACTN|nr:beta-propeller fold lactonase family protein [Actinoplanes bogorensis]MBU2665380.1 beta-propeller fold lactonase family protein [Actinoplanes bogorensis]
MTTDESGRADRLAAVAELRERAGGTDPEAAVAARAALGRLTSDDSRQVSSAAEEALAATSIALDPPRIDFGPVSPGTPRLSASVSIIGAPTARASRIKVTGPGLRARIAGDQLQVQWLPGAGTLSGKVSLDGPAGAADLTVTGHLGSGPLTGFAAEARQTALEQLGSLRPVAVERKPPRRSGKGLIIGLAATLVLLAGTGIAAAVSTNRSATPAVSAPPSAPPTTKPAPPREERLASVDKPTVAGTIRVGDEPEGVAVSPDSRTLYVANQSSRILSVVDLSTRTVKSVTLRNTARFVAVSRDGKRVFVSMYEKDLSGSGVAVVDAEKLTVLQNLQTGVQPYALSVAPDGRLWVPIHGGRNVEVYRAADLTLTGRVFVPENPHAVSFDADGQRAFTPDHESSTVSVIDTRNDQRLRSIPVSAFPHSLAVSPDGRTVVVACFGANAVDIIDTVTLARRGPFRVGTKPQAAAFATDSGHAYAVNEASNSVSVVDPRTGRVTATVPVGRSPRTMAVSPDGRFGYVSNGDDDTVTILRVS